jgi:hypothetical protein
MSTATVRRGELLTRYRQCVAELEQLQASEGRAIAAFNRSLADLASAVEKAKDSSLDSTRFKGQIEDVRRSWTAACAASNARKQQLNTEIAEIESAIDALNEPK